MVFKVTARDTHGVRRTFSREAESRSALMFALRMEQWLVLEVAECGQPNALPPAWHPSWLRPMSSFEIELGLRQLASMLKSGITLLNGLRSVAEQSATPRARRLWQGVADRVLSGSSFAYALQEHSRKFSEITVRLSEVGERSGALERTIGRAADQLEARRNLRTAVINALLYPAVAVLAAVGVSAYLVMAVIPKLAEFLQAGGTELPSITKSLMDFSEAVTTHWLAVVVSLAGVVAAWFVVRLNETGREAEDTFLLRIPVVGHILRLSATSLFARSMQIMTESGVTLLDALATCARLMDNRRFRRRVMAAHAGVMGGQSLADALAGAVEFTPMLRRMAAVGEVGGALPETFGETARLHEVMLAIAVKRFGMLIEPVMIVITGLIVGFVYIAFFAAIFAVASAN